MEFNDNIQKIYNSMYECNIKGDFDKTIHIYNNINNDNIFSPDITAECIYACSKTSNFEQGFNVYANYVKKHGNSLSKSFIENSMFVLNMLKKYNETCFLYKKAIDNNIVSAKIFSFCMHAYNVRAILARTNNKKLEFFKQTINIYESIKNYKDTSLYNKHTFDKVIEACEKCGYQQIRNNIINKKNKLLKQERNTINTIIN